MSEQDTTANSVQESEPRPPNLVLIGFMGVGKSRIGKMCARRLGYAFQDSDAVIEERVGCPIPDLFAREGEAAFRAREREIIAELSAQRGLVLSTGGGAVLNPENVANLRASGVIILLSASPETIYWRVGDLKSRPLLADAPNPLARIRDMMAERSECYRQAAHHVVDSTRRTPGSVVREVLALYESYRAE